MAPILTEMPKLAMEVILDKLDYISIQRLRKVCHSLRNLVDLCLKSCLKSYYTSVQIFIKDEHIRFLLQRNMFDDIEVTVEYYKREKTTFVIWHLRDSDSKRCSEYLQNTDYVESFFTDLNIFLKFHMRVFQRIYFTFDVDNPEFLDRIQKISRSSVKYFVMNITNQNQLSTVLPLFDVKKIIIGTSECRRDQVINLEKLGKTWENANEFRMTNREISASIQSLTHFANLDVKLKTFTVEDTLFLKQTFQQNPLLKTYRIEFSNKILISQLDEIFGPSDVYHGDRPYQFVWYFRTGNPEKVIQVLLYGNTISFWLYDSKSICCARIRD